MSKIYTSATRATEVLDSFKSMPLWYKIRAQASRLDSGPARITSFRIKVRFEDAQLDLQLNVDVGSEVIQWLLENTGEVSHV